MGDRAARIFDTMASSASAYAMCSVEPDREDAWQGLGTLWALANPKKGGNDEKYQKAVDMQGQLGPFSRSTRLFGLYVIGSKALSSSLSRPHEGYDEFCKMLNEDPTLEEKLELIRTQAIKANKL
jgi:hypothetical protein